MDGRTDRQTDRTDEHNDNSPMIRSTNKSRAKSIENDSFDQNINR